MGQFLFISNIPSYLPAMQKIHQAYPNETNYLFHSCDDTGNRHRINFKDMETLSEQLERNSFITFLMKDILGVYLLEHIITHIDRWDNPLIIFSIFSLLRFLPDWEKKFPDISSQKEILTRKYNNYRIVETCLTGAETDMYIDPYSEKRGEVYSFFRSLEISNADFLKTIFQIFRDNREPPGKILFLSKKMQHLNPKQKQSFFKEGYFHSLMLKLPLKTRAHRIREFINAFQDLISNLKNYKRIEYIG